ncbi:STAS domain-containing protein [Haladaptatus sp. R4]|uniref:STAS domain-containing protein n=1 Tax=Haladaptatus sp. R4 TaxID=1679489 RepID=UPI001CC1538F|nr:STAS domain-containing protein [Haladaptatus sp. R4]
MGRVPGSDEFSDLTRHPENERVPGVLVYRVDAELFFANAPTIRAAVMDEVDTRERPVSLVVLDMRSSRRRPHRRRHARIAGRGPR